MESDDPAAATGPEPPPVPVPPEAPMPSPPRAAGSANAFPAKARSKIPKHDSGDPNDPSSRLFKRAPTRVSGQALLSLGTFSSMGEAFTSGMSAGRALRVAAPTNSPDSTPTPKKHWDAMKLDEEGWTAAELKEIQNHCTNESWEVIPRSALPKRAASSSR